MKGAKVLLASVVAGMMLLAGSALAAFGYEGQVPAQVLLNGTCDGTTMTATVLDAQGASISDIEVSFSFVQKGDNGDSLAPASDTTNTQGKAKVGLSLVHVPGVRIVQAQAVNTDAQGSLTLNCKFGLPPTTADAAATGSSLPLALLFVAAALALAGAFGWRVVRARS